MVCISPLVSLMVDQQSKFSPKGLSTEYVGEAQPDLAVKRKVLNGDVQLVYISPECLIMNKTYRSMLLSPQYQQNLVALVIDEAHCVKTWGDSFRKAFAEIGDLRSIIPSSVNVLALTVTATKETYDVIVKRLSLENPTVVALPPFRNNISYSVQPKVDVHILGEMLYQELKAKRTSFPKTILYVRTYTDCSNLYMVLKRKMGSEITEPPGCPNVSGYRLIDMFNRALTEGKKEVLSMFGGKDTSLRLVIATTAFGMGVDIEDVRRIMHWGMPSTLEEYVQETGRCGRDGEASQAILYQGKHTAYTTLKVKNYADNTSLCRRRLLFRDFLLYCEDYIHVIGSKCCDVCGNSTIKV